MAENFLTTDFSIQEEPQEVADDTFLTADFSVKEEPTPLPPPPPDDGNFLTADFSVSGDSDKIVEDFRASQGLSASDPTKLSPLSRPPSRETDTPQVSEGTGTQPVSAEGALLFDPDGSGYDEKLAEEVRGRSTPLGEKPTRKGRFDEETIAPEDSFDAWVWHEDENEWVKHGSSFDPRTGRLLKGVGHPSVSKTFAEEERLGNKVIKKDDGFYYSVPKEGALSKEQRIAQLPEPVLKPLPRLRDVPTKAITENIYLGQQALSLTTQVVDFIPALFRGGGKNIKKFVLEPILGKKRTEGFLDFLPIENLDNVFDASGRVRADARQWLMESAREKGGKVGKFTAETVDAVEQTLMNLRMFEVFGVGYGVGAKGTAVGKVATALTPAKYAAHVAKTQKIVNVLKGALVRSGIMTATTEQDSLKGAASNMALSLAYQSTPAISGWFGRPASRIIADIALNFTISATQAKSAIEAADKAAIDEGNPQDKGLYRAIAMSQMFGSDAVFGFIGGRRGMRGDSAKVAVEKAQKVAEEAVPKVEGKAPEAVALDALKEAVKPREAGEPVVSKPIEVAVPPKTVSMDIKAEAAKERVAIESLQKRIATASEANARKAQESRDSGEEPKPDPSVTGPRNALINQEREQMGLLPRASVISKSLPESYKDAVAELDKNPNAATELMTDLTATTRPHTDKEIALLGVELANRKHTWHKALDAYNKAPSDAEMADLYKQTQVAAEEYRRVADVVQRAGTETARGLNARRLLIKDDLTLEDMIFERQILKGEPLSRNEVDTVKGEYDAISEAKAQLKEMKNSQHDKELSKFITNESRLAIGKTPPAKLDPEAKKAVGVLESGDKPATISKPVLEAAERIVNQLDVWADESRVFLRGKSFSIGPEMAFHLSRIGAAQIGRVGLDFGKWSTAMTAEFGEKIRPHLKKLWDSSKKAFNKTAKSVAKKHKTGIPKTMEDALEQLKEKGVLKKTLRDVAREHIKDGVTDITDLTTRLWNDIKVQTGEELSNDTIRETLSGYGKVSLPNKSVTEKKLRELTAMSRIISATQSALRGETPKKTGPQRDKPSAIVREQNKTLRKTMRAMGIEPGDSREGRLTSKLEAVKTRLKNRIEDLNRQIALGARDKEAKNVVGLDKEAIELKKEVERLDAVMDGIERASGAINDRKEASVMRILDASIKKYLQMIEAGDVRVQKAKTGATSPYSKALSDRQQLAKMLRKEVAEFRKAKALPSRTPDEKALSEFKKRVEKQTSELERRIAENDFEPTEKVKKDIKLDKDAAKAQVKLNRLQSEFARKNSKFQYDKMSPPMKVGYQIMSVLDAFRTLKSSFDFSALRRQGGLYLLGHPIKGLKAAKVGASALRSDAEMERMSNDIKSRANFDKYKKYDIGLADMDGGRAEEVFAIRAHGIGRNVEKLPGVPASQRSYTATLNQMRVDMFDGLEASVTARKGGEPLTAKDYKIIADMVRNTTGRATAGSADKAVSGLSSILWAPRLLLSRIKYLTNIPGYVWGSVKGPSKEANRAITAEILRQGAGLVTYYAMLAAVFGATPEEDPRSTKFGRLTIGKKKNIVLDPLSGFGQVITFLSRMATGERKTASGKIVKERGEDVSPFQRSTSDTIGKFIRSKLNPATGLGYDIATQRDFLGNHIDNVPGHIMMNAIPLGAKDVAEIMAQEGIPAGMLPSILALIGEGVQVWDDKSKSKSKNRKHRAN